MIMVFIVVACKVISYAVMAFIVMDYAVMASSWMRSWCWAMQTALSVVSMSPKVVPAVCNGPMLFFHLVLVVVL